MCFSFCDYLLIKLICRIDFLRIKKQENREWFRKNSQSFQIHRKVTMTSKADTKVIVDPGQDDLKYKKAHTFSDAGRFFPLHRNLFIMNIFFFIVLIVCGVLLILCGNYGNTGYFSFMSLTNKYPGVAVADEVTTALTLEFLQLSCWIGGI